MEKSDILMAQSDESLPQLRMLWPAERLSDPPRPLVAPGYLLQTCDPAGVNMQVHPYDRIIADFGRLMASAGWPGWDEARLAPWLPRMLRSEGETPPGWFMVYHQESGELVATAMALTDMGEFGETGGELGWVAAHPAHAGRGLGLAVSAAATTRMIQAGFRHIHLYTEDYRLAALKTYLHLGYRPFMEGVEVEERWRVICAQLGWDFPRDIHCSQ